MSFCIQLQLGLASFDILILRIKIEYLYGYKTINFIIETAYPLNNLLKYWNLWDSTVWHNYCAPLVASAVFQTATWFIPSSLTWHKISSNLNYNQHPIWFPSEPEYCQESKKTGKETPLENDRSFMCRLRCVLNYLIYYFLNTLW